MKILIFENDFLEIKPLFEVLKVDYDFFDYDYFTNSQGLSPFEKSMTYDKILVDLKLSDGTAMEGYDILAKLQELGYIMDNVAIITGHTDYKSRLQEFGLDNVCVIEKPLYLNEIENFLGLM